MTKLGKQTQEMIFLGTIDKGNNGKFYNPAMKWVINSREFHLLPSTGSIPEITDSTDRPLYATVSIPTVEMMPKLTTSLATTYTGDDNFIEITSDNENFQDAMDTIDGNTSQNNHSGNHSGPQCQTQREQVTTDTPTHPSMAPVPLPLRRTTCMAANKAKESISVIQTPQHRLMFKEPEEALLLISGPATYSEVLQSDNGDEWKQAIQDELDSMSQNN
ncbi:hypothetical protein IWQ62_002967, partial [Dispira parvispora]